MNARTSPSPLRQAVVATVVFAVLGVAMRYIGGAIDPDMRSWGMVALSPVSGLYTYRNASGRHRAIANLFVALGVFGLVFWVAMVLSGRLPATREDIPSLLVVFAFPVAALVLGLRRSRSVSRGQSS